MENQIDVEDFIAIITTAISDKRIISISTKNYKKDLLVRLKINKTQYRRIVKKEDYKSFIMLLGNRAFVTQTKESSTLGNKEENGNDMAE